MLSGQHRVAAAVLCLAAGCAGTRTISIDSEPPARILEGGGTACAKTPCEWTFSRETCWLFDSSSGHFRLVAVADDGRKLSSPMIKTCGVKKGAKVGFRFSAEHCGVTITEAGRESRFGCEGLPRP